MRAGFGLLLFSFVMLAAAPAQARSRDDVMAGAYCCGGVPDDKQWLDCYYGAAQPARAELGLQPAPELQLQLAALYFQSYQAAIARPSRLFVDQWLLIACLAEERRRSKAVAVRSMGRTSQRLS